MLDGMTQRHVELADQFEASPSQNMAADQSVKTSFEFFPPKNKKMEKQLWKTLNALEAFSPEFISVTYGAGGTTQEPTLGTVAKIVRETSYKPASHLTCVDATRDEIDDVARQLWASGVRHIVALRGDSPDGVGEAYRPHDGGYAYGSDLVAGLKNVADFEISVSAYPERHPESGSWDAEIDNLKRKVDAGATRAITQFFFGADTFCEFQDRVLDAGMDIPIVPGIMLQPNFAGLKRMSKMCGVAVPDLWNTLYDGLDDDVAARNALTTELAKELTADLYERGIRHFHFYTLNRSDIASDLARFMGMDKKVAAK